MFQFKGNQRVRSHTVLHSQLVVASRKQKCFHDRNLERKKKRHFLDLLFRFVVRLTFTCINSRYNFPLQSGSLFGQALFSPVGDVILQDFPRSCRMAAGAPSPRFCLSERITETEPCSVNGRLLPLSRAS